MEKLLPWFTLKSVPGIGPHLFKRLLERFSTPAAVLGASVADLEAVPGVSPISARRRTPRMKFRPPTPPGCGS